MLNRWRQVFSKGVILPLLCSLFLLTLFGKGLIAVSTELADDVSLFFSEALRIGFPIECIALAQDFYWDDNTLMNSNITSGFNYRKIAGSSKTSLHALGRAIDVNPVQNPYITYDGSGDVLRHTGDTWDSRVPGTLSADHPLVRLMVQLGWVWGGSWQAASGRTDYQHFEKTASA